MLGPGIKKHKQKIFLDVQFFWYYALHLFFKPILISAIVWTPLACTFSVVHQISPEAPNVDFNDKIFPNFVYEESSHFMNHLLQLPPSLISVILISKIIRFPEPTSFSS